MRLMADIYKRHTAKLNRFQILFITVNPVLNYLAVCYRIARCPVINRTVRHFGSLPGMKIIVIPDNSFIHSFRLFL